MARKVNRAGDKFILMFFQQISRFINSIADVSQRVVVSTHRLLFATDLDLIDVTGWSKFPELRRIAAIIGRTVAVDDV